MHTICGGKVQYPHYDLNSHYIWEKEMQYLHDNLTMHIVCGSKVQYPHYNPNPHYIWERETQYMHDNSKMQIICGGKVQYPHYDPNPHYIWEGNAILAWQFKDAHYMWVAKCNIGITTLLSMGGQNIKSIYQTWNIFSGI